MDDEAEMPVPVNAPRLDQARCRNERERRFLERLNERAKAGRWCADPWSHRTDHVLIATAFAAYHNRDPRIDYYGDRLLLGGDETGQYVTDLDPCDPDVMVIESGSPEEMADVAADWFEAQLRNRRVWMPGVGWRERSGGSEAHLREAADGA